MGTATESLAVGVNLIVKHFLVTHVGFIPKDMRTEFIQDNVFVLIGGLLPPAERHLLEGDGTTVTSYQQFREQLFKRSENLLRVRVSDFLQRRIKTVHYVFGSQSEDMSIVISLEPSLVSKEGRE